VVEVLGVAGKEIAEEVSGIEERQGFFRSDGHGPAQVIAEQAIKIGARVLWMQEGIVNEESAKKASEAGLTVIMDKCMYKEHCKCKLN
jgi:predicted CoA-binding protein